MEHVSEDGAQGDVTAAETGPVVDKAGQSTITAAGDGQSASTKASKKQSEEEAAMEMSRVSQVGAIARPGLVVQP